MMHGAYSVKQFPVLPVIVVRNCVRGCSADRYVNLQSKELTINLGLRAEIIPVFIRYIGALGGLSSP